MLIDQIQLDPVLYSGKTIFAVAEDGTTGNFWNGSAYAALTTQSQVIAGAIATTESGAKPGEFSVSGSSAIAAANLRITYYLQAGVSPATGDLQHPVGTGGSDDASASSGSGATPVTENTGGTDNLRAVDTLGNGVSGAFVTAYLSSEWTTNPLTATQRAQIVTKSDGRFVQPLMLNHGLSYTLVYEIQGFRTGTATVTP